MRAVTVGKRYQVASRPHASSSAAATSPPCTSPGPAWWRSSNEDRASYVSAPRQRPAAAARRGPDSPCRGMRRYSTARRGDVGARAESSPGARKVRGSVPILAIQRRPPRSWCARKKFSEPAVAIAAEARARARARPLRRSGRSGRRCLRPRSPSARATARVRERRTAADRRDLEAREPDRECSPPSTRRADPCAIELVPIMPRSWPVAANTAATAEAGVNATDCIPDATAPCVPAHESSSRSSTVVRSTRRTASSVSVASAITVLP